MLHADLCADVADYQAQLVDVANPEKQSVVWMAVIKSIGFSWKYAVYILRALIQGDNGRFQGLAPVEERRNIDLR